MSELPALVAALLDPSSYPHHPPKVEMEQTQISFVFLAGDYVYKVKKPVDFGFLDFTTLERRRFFCEQEVALNRRLCPDTYLGVVGIAVAAEGFRVEAEGEAVEYAVKMRRLPQERMLSRLLREGRADREMIERLAERIARFHREAQVTPEGAGFGDRRMVLTNTQENWTQTESYVSRSITAEEFRDIRDWSDRFLEENAALFDKRVREGRVRDCHGDLHATHICFADGICVFDCIEFNDRFRYADVASDIAFLAMDLDRYYRPDLSRAFVDAYVEYSGDSELLDLLRFYKCYRAYVRGKVEGFKLDDPHIPPPEKERVLGVARGYFALARAYALGERQPWLLITTGLIGTGKSVLAEGLAGRLGLVLVSSDVTRKELARVMPTERRFEPVGEGIYSREFSRRTYDEMYRRAREHLARGESVILDASFPRAEERERARALAEEAGAGFRVLECRCPDEALQERLERRVARGSVSDGRWEIFADLKREFEDIGPEMMGQRIVVDTSRPREEALQQALAALEDGLPRRAGKASY